MRFSLSLIGSVRQKSKSLKRGEGEKKNYKKYESLRKKSHTRPMICEDYVKHIKRDARKEVEEISIQ